MVNRQFWLWGVLGFLFFTLLFSLLHRQLGENHHLLELFQMSENLDILLIQSYSLPRIYIALLAGGSLALASSLLQQVMNNPLASDNTLGISSGAQLGLFLCAIFLPQGMGFSNSLIALLGAGISLALVLSLSCRRTMSPLLLILAGLVVNLYFGALSSTMMLFYPEESRGLAQWGAGSLTQESWRDSQYLTVQLVGCVLVISLFIRLLSMLALNESNAKSLGVPVGKLRIIGVLISAYLIATVVSAVGMLGFVGLAASTIVRQLGIRHFKVQLIAAFGIGALLLGITDLLLQLFNTFYAIDLPTGAVTAILGTPLLLWLMFRSLAHTGRLTSNPPEKRRDFRPRFWGIVILLSMIFLLLALGLGKGEQSWSFRWDFSPDFFVLRYPRVLTAIAVGILLAVAGVILQRLTLNPMASPELLGVSSGASMGILVVLFVFSSQHNAIFWGAGILGAVIALLILMLINQRNGMLPEKVLLTGISLAAFFMSLQTIAIASNDPRASQLIAWVSGSTQQVSPELALPFLVVALLLLCFSLIFIRWLALLALQTPIAQSLGLNIRVVRFILILFSAILSALATLIIGPLSFIGLLVPHLTRFLGAYQPRQQLLLSALLGSVIMLLSDWIGRQILFPYEVPAGLVATLIGGAYFLIVMRKV